MADYLVDHSAHGRVRVSLDTPIKDQGELHKALNDKIKAGDFSTMESDGQPKSILAKADAAYRAVADMATNAVGGVASSGLQGLGVPEDWANTLGHGAAQFAIPQSPLEAGLMLGTMGAGGMAAKAGLKGAKAIGARVLGGMAGGAAGGAINEDPGAGALTGAATGLVSGAGGEVVGMTLQKASKIVGTLLRGGSQEAVARVQAKGAIEVGKALESMPELASVQVGPTGGLQRGTSIFEGYNTSEALRGLVKSGKGHQILKDAYSEGLTLVENSVPTGALFTSPFDPTMSVPFKQAKKELSELFAHAYTPKQANPETANIIGANAKEKLSEANVNLRADLLRHDPTGTASAAFDASQTMYRTGVNLLKSLQPAFREKTNDRIIFDVAALQSHYADKQRPLQASMTQDVYDRMTKALKIDGIIGMVNQPPKGMSGLAVGSRSGGAGGYIRENIGQYLSGPPRLAGTQAPLGIGRTAIDVGTGRVAAPIAQGVLDEMQ